MTEFCRVRCGRFELLGRPADITVDGDVVRLRAEASYGLAPRDGSAMPADLALALTMHVGSTVGTLRFGNFVGLTEIDGRPVQVESQRLDTASATNMLDAVIERIGGIPIQARAPTGSDYARTRDGERETEYLTFALVRDAMRARGPHDLRAAVERVLARPHEQLHAERRTVPIWRVDRVDASVLMQLVTTGCPRMQVPPTSSLADSPVVHAMGGSVPERITIGRAMPTTNTRENRFVVMVLEYLAQRMHEVAISAGEAGARAVAREARELAGAFERWRHQPALAPLEPLRSLPATSTVLRGRAGYRQVLAFWVDLLARSALVPPADARRMVALRDAATTYEYWCFFAVCDAVAATLRVRNEQMPKTTWQGPLLESGFLVSFGNDDVAVRFNQRFAKSDSAHHSYSVVLRPDIVLEVSNGDRHVFDAKFAFDSMSTDAEDDEDPVTRARRAHVHKMHTYRDALEGVRSVRVLYPGTAASSSEFHSVDGASDIDGVGALALRPGDASQFDALSHEIRRLLRE